MTWGRMKVRNACPFSVTFYALAGPTLELAPGETKTAHACLIWFATRVKGPSGEISNDDLKSYSINYYNKLEEEGIDPGDIPGVDDGSDGATIASFLKWCLPQLWDGLISIFKVKNTRDGNDVFIGSKKDEVYGNSDLVVFASLDPGCVPKPELGKVWYLHLENDHGQDTEPTYVKPDLVKYADTMFVRICNSAGYLSSTWDKSGVELVDNSEPYNPLEYPSYWTIRPESNNETNKIKILNAYAQKWLTDFSSDGNIVGLYPVGYDFEDQHWDITEINKNPEVVTIKNSFTRLNIFANKNVGIGVYDPDYPDQHFTIQTFTTDLSNAPDGVTFRIMHAQTGKYITISDSGYASLQYTDAGNQLFYIKNLDGDMKICSVEYDSYLTFYWSDSRYYLATCPMHATLYEHNPDQVWEFDIDAEFAGVYIKNKQGVNKGMSNLYYNNDNGFGLYFGDCPDQLWVFQLETTDPS